MNKINVDIIGSCVVRDIFSIHSHISNIYEVRVFLQSQSPLSIGYNRLSEVIGYKIPAESFEKTPSAWYRWFDINAEEKVYDILEYEKSQYLLLSLDELFYSIFAIRINNKEARICGSDGITKNKIFEKHNLQYAHISPMEIEACELKRLLVRHMEKLAAIYNQENIIFLEIYPAQCYLEDNCIKYFNSNICHARLINFLKNAYQIAETTLPDMQVIKLPENLIGDLDHKWGKGIQHFYPDVYEYLGYAVDAIIQGTGSKAEREQELLRLVANYRYLEEHPNVANSTGPDSRAQKKSNPRIACVVSGDGNILYQAIVTLESVKRHNPDFDCFIVSSEQNPDSSILNFCKMYNIKYIPLLDDGREWLTSFKGSGNWPKESYIMLYLPNIFSDYDYCISIEYDFMCIAKYDDNIFTGEDIIAYRPVHQFYGCVRHEYINKIKSILHCKSDEKLKIICPHGGFVLFNVQKWLDLKMSTITASIYNELDFTNFRGTQSPTELLLAASLIRVRIKPQYLPIEYNGADLYCFLSNRKNIHFYFVKPWQSFSYIVDYVFRREDLHLALYLMHMIKYIEYIQKFPFKERLLSNGLTTNKLESLIFDYEHSIKQKSKRLSLKQSQLTSSVIGVCSFDKRDLYKPLNVIDADEFIVKTKNQRYFNPSLKLNAYTSEELDAANLANINQLPVRFHLYKNDYRYDFFLKHTPGAQKLYVVFSGSKSPNVFPLFKRHSWNYWFDGSVVYISDPMLYKYKTLHLGWYIGDNKVDLFNDISIFINDISNHVKSSKIITYGSSGGGYAALKIANYIPCNAIAINPQIYLQNYHYFNEFIKITNITSDQDFIEHTQIQINKQNKYFIIQNETEKHDMDCHLFPFMKKLGIIPKYGLSRKDNVDVFIYHAFGGHNAQEDPNILQFILYFADNLFYRHIDASRYSELDNLAIALSNLWADKQWNTYLAHSKK